MKEQKYKVKIEWVSTLLTSEEAEDLISKVVDIHSQKYGTDAASKAIKNEGIYNGVCNRIKVEVNKID